MGLEANNYITFSAPLDVGLAPMGGSQNDGFQKGGLADVPWTPKPERGHKKKERRYTKRERGYKNGTTVQKKRNEDIFAKTTLYKTDLLVPLEPSYDPGDVLKGPKLQIGPRVGGK